MATLEECKSALEGLAANLAGLDHKSDFERSLSCMVTDLNVILKGHFKDGSFVDIAEADKSDGDIKLTTSSDDLIALCDGNLNVAKAWAGGRLKVDASIMDMMKLRELLK